MERAADSCHRFVGGPKKDKIFQNAQNGKVLCDYYAHDAGLGFRSDCLDTLAPLAVCYQGWNYSTIHGLHAAGPILRQTASSLLWTKNRLLQRRLYEQSSENQETGT